LPPNILCLHQFKGSALCVYKLGFSSNERFVSHWFYFLMFLPLTPTYLIQLFINFWFTSQNVTILWSKGLSLRCCLQKPSDNFSHQEENLCWTNSWRNSSPLCGKELDLKCNQKEMQALGWCLWSDDSIICKGICNK